MTDPKRTYMQPKDWEFSDEITRGVEHLNEHDPQWYEKVDLDKLNMRYLHSDVLTLTGIDGNHYDHERGFNTLDNDRWDQLNAEWRQTIESLRTRPTLPEGRTLLVQNPHGYWSSSEYFETAKLSYGGWMGKPAGGFWTAHEPEPMIPNPAWRATLQRPEAQPEQEFIVGETYRVVKKIPGYKYGHPGTHFTVDSIDSDGDAMPKEGPLIYYARNYLRSGHIERITTTHPQQESTMDLKEANRAMHEAFAKEYPVGTRVRITRGWSNTKAKMYGAPKQYDVPTNCEATIRKHESNHITLDNGYAYPCWVLEPLSAQLVEVRLNREYTATIHRDTIEVGCQHFPISIIDDLVAARKKVQS